jgi:hypothetical protein
MRRTKRMFLWQGDSPFILHQAIDDCPGAVKKLSLTSMLSLSYFKEYGD